MLPTKPVAFAAFVALFASAACGGTSSGNSDGGEIALQLQSDDAFCFGQKAQLPASAAVAQTITATRSETSRVDSPDVYVSYNVARSGIFLYLSFAPDLPASFTTAQARAAFKYAYIEYDLPQSDATGPKLVLLDSNVLLNLSDFEELEVVDGVVSWRLAQTNAGQYSKLLSTKDLDASVDTSLCLTGDILGQCTCEFSGPATQVTLDGTFPI